MGRRVEGKGDVRLVLQAEVVPLLLHAEIVRTGLMHLHYPFQDNYWRNDRHRM